MYAFVCLKLMPKNCFECTVQYSVEHTHTVDHIHKWQPINNNYFFVLVLIRPTSLISSTKLMTKQMLLQSETSWSHQHEDKRITYLPSFMNLVYRYTLQLIKVAPLRVMIPKLSIHLYFHTVTVLVFVLAWMQ